MLDVEEKGTLTQAALEHLLSSRCKILKLFTDVRGVASLQRIAPTSNFVILEPAGTLARLAHMHPKLTTKKPWEVEFADGLLHLLTSLDGVTEGPSRRGFYDSTSCLLPTSTNSRFLMGFVFGNISGLTLNRDLLRMDMPIHTMKTFKLLCLGSYVKTKMLRCTTFFASELQLGFF